MFDGVVTGNHAMNLDFLEYLLKLFFSEAFCFKDLAGVNSLINIDS